MKPSFSMIAMMVSLSALSALTVHTFLSQPSPTFVSVDVKSTLNAYHQALIKKEMSLEEQTKRLTQFADIMHEEIEAYNAQHNTIALVSAAVVVGAVDITPQIQRSIITRYQDKE
ncbi:type-F conjugative transfer system protein TrbI [Vibrio parahaemolyticus]|uniref:type-F conjugative transfer system protein TrbI n=1 Tax=Vibrio parahaemolyticus TaxID=670 RepID=UPI001B823402|nr:type-F conjugative transfer system protein TrbI [Vibrio parahaemolyticus]UJW96481.1 type-F conjugative transfer system protein TrbI [Vibrio parahaemolyticus]HBB9944299.1 type-F conjugative transfer system protein TrbI [Vibrio parahaemolyticus]HBC3416770.1 type-F conjugative transfer system protein TrbI [Vibrio parahaemolyticus]HBC3602252.1 type-F conjugative transfer system protein TrbI [Vibrio parahaemolyticus]HBC3878322.1 type-F conjugative transfer system protein TrbI [Vibrio parahaemoly